MNISFWLADVQLFQVRVLEGCYRREGILLMALCLFLSLSLASSIEHIQAVSACPSAGLQVHPVPWCPAHQPQPSRRLAGRSLLIRFYLPVAGLLCLGAPSSPSSWALSSQSCPLVGPTVLETLYLSQASVIMNTPSPRRLKSQL